MLIKIKRLRKWPRPGPKQSLIVQCVANCSLKQRWKEIWLQKFWESVLVSSGQVHLLRVPCGVILHILSLPAVQFPLLSAPVCHHPELSWWAGAAAAGLSELLMAGFVTKEWLVVITGQSLVDKTAIVHLLAQLVGVKVETLSKMVARTQWSYLVSSKSRIWLEVLGTCGPSWWFGSWESWRSSLLRVELKRANFSGRVSFNYSSSLKRVAWKGGGRIK